MRTQRAMPNKMTNNLTNDSKAKKKVASDSYPETFSKRVPDPHALQKTIDALTQANKRLSSDEKEQIRKFTDLESLDLDEDESVTNDWLFQTIESLKVVD